MYILYSKLQQKPKVLQEITESKEAELNLPYLSE